MMILLARYTLLMALLRSVVAFTPQPFLTKASIAASSTGAFLDNVQISPFLIADGDEAAMIKQAFEAVPDAGGGAFEILKNIGLAVGGICIILLALATLSATVIIPAAAKELEQECKELAPDLWEEYQLKLEPGQTMENRPDLIQELGIKLQPLLDAKIERQFADAKEKGIDVSEDEAAWKAIDSMNEQVPKVPSMSTLPTDVQDAVIVDVSNVGMNQWDDDDDDVKAKK